MSTTTVTDRPKPGHRLSAAAKQALVAACMTDRSKTQIAKDFGIRRESLSRIIRAVKDVKIPGNPLAEPSLVEIRRELRTIAFASVKRGLIDDADVYKSANVACRVLEGLGEFAVPGQSQVNVAIVSTTPAEWRARYLTVNSDSHSDDSKSDPIPVATLPDKAPPDIDHEKVT